MYLGNPFESNFDVLAIFKTSGRIFIVVPSSTIYSFQSSITVVNRISPLIDVLSSSAEYVFGSGSPFSFVKIFQSENELNKEITRINMDD